MLARTRADSTSSSIGEGTGIRRTRGVHSRSYDPTRRNWNGTPLIPRIGCLTHRWSVSFFNKGLSHSLYTLRHAVVASGPEGHHVPLRRVGASTRPGGSCSVAMVSTLFRSLWGLDRGYVLSSEDTFSVLRGSIIRRGCRPVRRWFCRRTRLLAVRGQCSPLCGRRCVWSRHASCRLRCRSLWRCHGGHCVINRHSLSNCLGRLIRCGL